MFVVLVIGLALMRESHEQPGATIEQNFVSWLVANTTRQSPAAPLALVEINDASLAGEHPWPWSPLDYALFLEAVLNFKPDVVGIEPPLEWNLKELPPDAQQKFPQYEKILHDRILRAPKILLGAELGFPEDPDIIPPLQPVPVFKTENLTGSVNAIPEFTSIEREPREDLRLAASLGFTNLPASENGVSRAPLLFRYRGQVVPSFVLQGLMLWFKVTLDEVKINIGSQITLGDKAKVPIDSAGSMLIDWKSPLTRVSFDDLLLAVQQAESKQKPVVAPEVVRGRFALLARTDAGVRTFDLPIGRKGSPGELFAAAIATVQNGHFIHRVGIWFDACVILFLMIWSWPLHRWRRRNGVIATAVLLIVYLMIGLAVFNAKLITVPLVLPAGLAVIVMIFRLLAPRDLPRVSATKA